MFSIVIRRLSLGLGTAILVACGGGGGDAGGSGAASSSSGSLTVEVSTSTGQGVELSSGVYYVPDPASVVLTCNEACTATPQTPQGVTVTQASSSAQGWTATLDFASVDSSLDVRMAATDGSSVVVRLRTRAVATSTTAGWSLDAHSWSRTRSTQSSLGGSSGPATTGLTVHSQAANCQVGPYACGTVSVHFYGTTVGTFTIDPDFLTSPKPGRAWVNVKATGGTVNDVINGCTPLVSVSSDHMYNTDYRPTAGQIRVTQDRSGQFVVTTDAPLTVFKQPDSDNLSLCIRSVALPDAPATASVQLRGVY